MGAPPKTATTRVPRDGVDIIRGSRCDQVFRDTMRRAAEEGRTDEYTLATLDFMMEVQAAGAADFQSRKNHWLRRFVSENLEWHGWASEMINPYVAGPPRRKRMTRTERRSARARINFMAPMTCCGKEQVIVDGMPTCTVCGEINGPDFAEGFQERETHAFTSESHYNPMNHLEQIMDQLAGTPRDGAPAEILERVKDAMRRRRIEPVTMTALRMHSLLQELGLSEYYEFEAQLANAVGGIRGGLNLTPQLREAIRTMFMHMNKTFTFICPVGRQNLISYRYVISKCLELLQRPDLSRQIRLLKSSAKIHELDDIWKEVCLRTGWRYRPTPIV